MKSSQPVSVAVRNQDPVPALAANQERFRMAMEAAKIGTFDWDMVSGAIFWSDNLESFLGLQPGTFEGTLEAFNRFVRPDDRERVQRVIQNAIQTGAAYKNEFRMIRTDGSIRWVQARGQVLLNKNGQPVRMIGIDIDITERKQAEEDLLSSQAEAKAQAENLAAILDAVPGMTFIAEDPSCQSMRSSRAAYDMLRLPVGSNTSKSAPETERPSNFRALKDGRELAPEELPVQRAAATGETLRDYELTLAFDDGTSRHIFGNAVPLLDEKGAVRGAVGAFVDITERKRFDELTIREEIRRRLLEREILAREEERRRLARELHDEVGQMLASLLAGLRLIEGAKTVKVARAQVKALRDLASRTIDEMGRLARDLHPIVLDDLGLEIALRNYVSEYAALHGINGDLQINGLDHHRLPRALELGLYRIVQEGLTNVAKHADAKSFSVAISRDSNHLTMTIADDGAGFKPSVAARPGKAQLGCQGMAERASILGGHLKILSEAGKGTRVIVTVPAADSQLSAGDPEPR
jgi:PAS domain S-box-containing protein